MNRNLICSNCSPSNSFVIRKKRIHVQGVYLPSLVEVVCCRICMRVVGVTDESMAAITLVVKRRQLKDPMVVLPTFDDIIKENTPN